MTYNKSINKLIIIHLDCTQGSKPASQTRLLVAYLHILLHQSRYALLFVTPGLTASFKLFLTTKKEKNVCLASCDTASAVMISGKSVVFPVIEER